MGAHRCKRFGVLTTSLILGVLWGCGTPLFSAARAAISYIGALHDDPAVLLADPYRVLMWLYSTQNCMNMLMHVPIVVIIYLRASAPGLIAVGCCFHCPVVDNGGGDLPAQRGSWARNGRGPRSLGRPRAPGAFLPYSVPLPLNISLSLGEPHGADEVGRCPACCWEHPQLRITPSC
jgi:hypothetical protein